MLKCLAFIPLDCVMERFLWIKKCFSGATAFEPFLKYVERTWLSESPYPPSLWNMHDVLMKHPEDVVKRSNMSCESFNSDFIRRIKRSHPNIYTLIEILRHIEHSRMREWKNESNCN